MFHKSSLFSLLLAIFLLTPSFSHGWYCRLCKKEHTKEEVCTKMPWPSPYNRKTADQYLREHKAKDQRLYREEMKKMEKEKKEADTKAKNSVKNSSLSLLKKKSPFSKPKRVRSKGNNSSDNTQKATVAEKISHQ